MKEQVSKLYALRYYLRSNDLSIPNFGLYENLETIVNSQVSSLEENSR